MLHELPAGELDQHVTTGPCPCSPLRTVGERPDHAPGVMLLHWPFAAAHDEEGPVSRAPLVEPAG